MPVSHELTFNLAFGPVLGMGGTERRMVDVVTELVSRDALVRVLTAAPAERRLTAAMVDAGAQVIVYNSTVELVRQAVGCAADATWAFGARVAYPIAIVRRIPSWKGGRLLVAKNGLEELRSGPSMLVERVLLRSADLVVANSHAAADLAVSRSRVRPERVRIVSSALPSDWTIPITREQRSVVRIGMIGNDRLEKQHALGIRTFAELNDEATILDVFTNNGAHLTVELANLPSSVRDRISIHEGVSVTVDVMRSIDVLLHPSSSESLPRVALEARSQGAWVVGFDVGDLAQYCLGEIPWGDAPRLVASLRDACHNVRMGDWPAPVEVPSVPAYVDRLVALIREPQLSKGTG